MNTEIKKLLENIEVNARILTDIPASEQHIGHIQVVLSAALFDIKRCLEMLAKTKV